MRLILIACIQLLFWVEVYSDNNLPTYQGYHPTFSCDDCANQLNTFCCERPKDIWDKDPNKRICCDFPAEGQGICKGDGEKCGEALKRKSTNENNVTMKTKQTKKYTDLGKCCDGFICQNDGLIGKCVKDEKEGCEKDEDCPPEQNCVKQYRYYRENLTDPNGQPDTAQQYIVQEIKNRTGGKCTTKTPVEGQKCTEDTDCCVNKDPNDCEFQCVKKFRQFTTDFSTNTSVIMRTQMMNRKDPMCFPKDVFIQEFGTNVCRYERMLKNGKMVWRKGCGTPCTVFKNDEYAPPGEGVCDTDERCQEKSKVNCPLEPMDGTEYTYDVPCCEREFRKVLKEESKMQMCIGLCTPKTIGRIPTVCDDVKGIPDRMCKTEKQTKP